MSQPGKGITSLISEMQRRNVIRVAAGYAVVAWLLIQLAETILPLFGFDETPTRLLVIALAIGFVPVVVLAWVFEWTPEGLVRDRGQDAPADPAHKRRFDRIIMVALALAVTLMAVHTFLIDPARDAERMEAVAKDARTGALRESYGDKSIAVLPFVNMSADPEQVYFSDGISEELLNLLVRVEGLRVISRTSSFRFKDSELSIPELAERLDVAHILEGSVRKSGNRLRITAQLIDARADVHLWSETYDREMDDIFAIQDDVANRVVGALRLAMDVEPPIATRHDPAAYALYMQANQLLKLDDPAQFDRIERLLEQALSLEPDYVDAKIAMALLYQSKAWAVAHAGDREFGEALLVQRNEVLAEVEAAHPDNVRLNTMLAWQELTTGDPAAAARRIEQALESDPRDYSALLMAMIMSADLGRFERAIRIGEYLSRRDPMGFWAHANLAEAYFNTGRYEEALAAYRTAAAISPDAVGIQWKLGFALLVNGRAEEALDHMNREAHDAYRLHGRAMALHDLGDEAGSAEALRALHALKEGPEAQGGEWPFGLARAYAWLGDADQAVEYLEPGIALGSPEINVLATHAYFDRIRSDPRVQRMIETLEADRPDVEFNPPLPPELLAAL